MEFLKWKRGGKWIENDEGYHYEMCYTCRKKTEHDWTSCIPCGNRKTFSQKIIKQDKVGEYTVKTYPNGTKFCNCKGFRYRKTCKHLTTFN